MQSDNEEIVDVCYLKREAFAAKQTKIHSITKHLEVNMSRILDSLPAVSFQYFCEQHLQSRKETGSRKMEIFCTLVRLLSNGDMQCIRFNYI